MSLRVDFKAVEPAAYDAQRAIYQYVVKSGVEPTLHHLIDVRVSQINGCAFCLDMHTREARAAGESEHRLYTLNAWRETPYFTPRERAVLALAESVTEISTKGVPDAVYNDLTEHFSPAEIVRLIMAVISINGWNRIAITTGMQPPER